MHPDRPCISSGQGEAYAPQGACSTEGHHSCARSCSLCLVEQAGARYHTLARCDGLPFKCAASSTSSSFCCYRKAAARAAPTGPHSLASKNPRGRNRMSKKRVATSHRPHLPSQREQRMRLELPVCQRARSKPCESMITWEYIMHAAKRRWLARRGHHRGPMNSARRPTDVHRSGD